MRLTLSAFAGGLVLVTSLVGCADQRTSGITAPRSASASANHNSHDDAPFGFTDGWQNGTTVSFFYSKPFFCAEPPASGAPSQCEVGEDGTVDRGRERSRSSMS